MMDGNGTDVAGARDAGAWQVFLVFLRLGLTSFGGPVAHLGYFRHEFVARRGWLSDRDYSDLVALCQFLPGPASSQVGFALGLGRAGWRGALAAWAGFTLPSALVLIALGLGALHAGQLAGAGWIHGLQIVAVAVVAQAVWGMGRSLCPDRTRAGVAIAAALACLLVPGSATQVLSIAAAGALGAWLVREPSAAAGAPRLAAVSARQGLWACAMLLALLVALPLWAAASGSAGVALIDGVFRAGALVFGGGHVVLPLLQDAVVGTGAVDEAAFLAGYGAAQAVPGPLFTFAAYLGAVAQGPLSGWIGGLVLLLAVFAPGMLVLVGALPFWDAWRARPAVRNIVAGVNAGVVGVLLAALYDPVWTHAIAGPRDFALALLCFALLVFGRVSPVWVVLLGAVGAGMMGWLAP